MNIPIPPMDLTALPLILQGTTVIAVRGTLNALDVLHDVTLWLVPAVLQRLGRPSSAAKHGDVHQKMGMKGDFHQQNT